MIHGVFWSAVEKYSSMAVSLVVSMILARLLTPSDYGTVAVVTVVIVFLQIFGSMGMGPAVIQRKDLTHENLNSIFTFSVIVGVILSILLFCSSWLIAAFYGDDKLIPICQVLSVQLFFASINVVPNALMTRDKRFKTLARRTFLLSVLSGLISVSAALFGAGLYALVISPVLTAVVIFCWNQYYYRLTIDLHFDREPVKRIFSFSGYQFLFDFVNYFSRNLDKLIIGKFMTLDALGIYEKSYRLMQMPMQNVTSVINPVLQPVLRDLGENPEELGVKYAKIIKFVATISFPLGVLLHGIAGECIRFFYGGNWDAAIPVFAILSLSLPLQMILSTSGPIYMVCNNTRMQFWLGIRNTVTTVGGFLLSACCFGTIEAMAWAWTITLFLNFLFTYHLMYRYVLKISIIPMLKELVKPALIGLFVHLLLRVLGTVDFGELVAISLLLKVSLSLLAILVCVQVLRQYDIMNYIKQKNKAA